MGVVVVIAAGRVPGSLTGADLPDDARLIIADGGLETARNLGLVPDDVVGDLDSCRGEDLAWAREQGAEIHRFDPDKNATDLELSLRIADAARPDRVVVTGIDGGRLDHWLGNWAVVADPARSSPVEVITESGRVDVVHGSIGMRGEVGQLVSLVPWGGPTTGVSTTGLRWDLDGAELSPFSSQGISNEFRSAESAVAVETGVLLVVRPRRD